MIVGEQQSSEFKTKFTIHALKYIKSKENAVLLK